MRSMKRGTSASGTNGPDRARAPAAAAPCPPARAATTDRRGRQRRQLAERRDPPAVEDLESRICFTGRGFRGWLIWFTRRGLRGSLSGSQTRIAAIRPRERPRIAIRSTRRGSRCIARPVLRIAGRATRSPHRATARRVARVPAPSHIVGQTVSPGTPMTAATHGLRRGHRDARSLRISDRAIRVPQPARSRDPRSARHQRSASARCRSSSSLPIVCGSPSRRPSPLTSSTTQSLP